MDRSFFVLYFVVLSCGRLLSPKSIGQREVVRTVGRSMFLRFHLLLFLLLHLLLLNSVVAVAFGAVYRTDIANGDDFYLFTKISYSEQQFECDNSKNQNRTIQTSFKFFIVAKNNYDNPFRFLLLLRVVTVSNGGVMQKEREKQEVKRQREEDHHIQIG